MRSFLRITSTPLNYTWISTVLMCHQCYKSKFNLMHPPQTYCPNMLVLLRVRQDSSVLCVLGVLTTIMRKQGCINIHKRIHCRSTSGLINCHQPFPKIIPVTALIAKMFYIHFLSTNSTCSMYTILHCNCNKVTNLVYSIVTWYILGLCIWSSIAPIIYRLCSR